MSVDPDQPSSSDATPAKPATDPSGENAETLRLKRRFKKGNESDEDEKPDQTIQLLSSLLQDLIAKKELPTTVEPESKAAKYHRLSKTGSGATGAPPEAPNPPGPVPVASAPAAAAPASALAAPATSAPAPFPAAAVNFRPAPQYQSSSRRLWLWVSLLGFLVFLGAIGGTIFYFMPQAPSGKETVRNGPAGSLPPTWTDAMLNQLEQALSADQAGDLKSAERIALAIKRPETPSPVGLDLYLATLGTRLDHSFDVDADLLRAINNASPEGAAAIDERLAFNFSRARDFEKAASFYQAGSRIDPFSAPLFYHWGDTLRHLGHFQEASAAFRAALARIPVGQPEVESFRECVNLKLRLSLLERGQESEFQNELAERTKTTPGSGYWLLTAAAVALQHRDTTEAAAFLGRAREALGAAQFDGLLNDYFFRAYADRKELADFFPTNPATRRAKLMPTMTYSVEP